MHDRFEHLDFHTRPRPFTGQLDEEGDQLRTQVIGVLQTKIYFPRCRRIHFPVRLPLFLGQGRENGPDGVVERLGGNVLVHKKTTAHRTLERRHYDLSHARCANVVSANGRHRGFGFHAHRALHGLKKVYILF
jgi:hypothetical protein